VPIVRGCGALCGARAATTSSGGGGDGGGGDAQSALFDAINARKAKQEERMRAIEAGELTVEDPREKRLKEQQAAKKGARKAAKRGT